MSCVCSKNNGEGHVEKSFLAIAGLLVRFLTLPLGSGRDSCKKQHFAVCHVLTGIYIGKVQIQLKHKGLD